MKLLKTIRFDESDGHVFSHAAVADEWAISGAFELADIEAEAVTGKLRQALLCTRDGPHHLIVDGEPLLGELNRIVEQASPRKAPVLGPRHVEPGDRARNPGGLVTGANAVTVEMTGGIHI